MFFVWAYNAREAMAIAKRFRWKRRYAVGEVDEVDGDEGNRR
jgi:hypothetical protein